MNKTPNLIFTTYLIKIPKKDQDLSSLPRRQKISLLALYDLAESRNVKARVRDLKENMVSFREFTDVQLNFRLTKKALELGLM